MRRSPWRSRGFVLPNARWFAPGPRPLWGPATTQYSIVASTKKCVWSVRVQQRSAVAHASRSCYHWVDLQLFCPGPNHLRDAMAAAEYPQAGNVCLLRGGDGVVHLRHCITSESWELPPGDWRLTDMDNGDCELTDSASGKTTTTSRHFRMKVFAEGGASFVRLASGETIQLRVFLAEHVVKYDHIVGFGPEGRVPIKAFVLLRGSRGARVFLELFDIVRALGAHDKKSQTGKQFVLNMHGTWLSALASRGVPGHHIRKSRPRTASPPPGFDAEDPFEGRIFDEAAISFIGAVIVLARYWEAKVRKSQEAQAATALLLAMFANYLPQEWTLTIVLDPVWPIPWAGGGGHGWQDYDCAAPALTLPIACGVVDMSSLLAFRGGPPLAVDCKRLCDALGATVSVDLVELLKLVWLAPAFLWFCRQLLWQLHTAMELSFMRRPGITDPLCVPLGLTAQLGRGTIKLWCKLSFRGGRRTTGAKRRVLTRGSTRCRT